MAETLTMNEAPADQQALNADEQDSLAVAESLEAGEAQEQPLLAGKFKDSESLEKAYLELQQKLGEPRDEVQTSDDKGEPAEQEDSEEEVESEVITEEQANQIFEALGGEKAYKSMIDWAAQNLTSQEIKMYDSVMGKGDPNSIFFAVQALHTKYLDAVGKDGQLLTGKGSSDSGSAFRSQQELVQAMSDPRYDRDPAYRQEVILKLQNSDIEF